VREKRKPISLVTVRIDNMQILSRKMDVPDMDILPPLVGGRCPPERFERPQNHRARGTCLQARCWVREHALSASGTQVPTANHWPRARRMRCGRAAPQIGQPSESGVCHAASWSTGLPAPQVGCSPLLSPWKPRALWRRLDRRCAR